MSLNKIIPCNACKHFNNATENCEKFIKNISLINNKHEYNLALSVRNDEKQCGKDAKNFEMYTKKEYIVKESKQFLIYPPAGFLAVIFQGPQYSPKCILTFLSLFFIPHFVIFSKDFIEYFKARKKYIS